VPNLLQYVGSGMDYARIKVACKFVRRRLKGPLRFACGSATPDFQGLSSSRAQHLGQDVNYASGSLAESRDLSGGISRAQPVPPRPTPSVHPKTRRTNSSWSTDCTAPCSRSMSRSRTSSSETSVSGGPNVSIKDAINLAHSGLLSPSARSQSRKRLSLQFHLTSSSRNGVTRNSSKDLVAHDNVKIIELLLCCKVDDQRIQLSDRDGSTIRRLQ
jgi:hypothetical protein